MKCWEECDEEWVQSQSYSIISIFIPNGDFPCFFGITVGIEDERREVEISLDRIRTDSWL